MGGEANSYSLQVGLQIAITTMKINIEVPQTIRNKYIMWSSYITLKTCCSIHNINEMEKV